jgi:hypothetical protein
MKKYFLILILAVITTACPVIPDVEYPDIFPTEVTNFEMVNSEYDDYNSDLPRTHFGHNFYFSSNRKRSGENFDIINKSAYFNLHQGEFTYEQTLNDFHPVTIPKAMWDSINTSYNELGPYSVSVNQYIADDELNWTEIFMYANDSDGDFNIKFIYYKYEENYSDGTTKDTLSSIQEIQYINTEADELYPCFFGKNIYDYDYGYHRIEINPENIESLIYCSNLEGNFNIYEVAFAYDPTVVSTLSSSESQESVKLDLNSSYDDKCAYVNGELMVFTSNRPGGMGGFDLYYSQYIDEKWSDPVNFGDSINTEYNEYRPVTLKKDGYDNNLMLFSSDRPGGKGGYDLYYIGIDQKIY